MTAEAVGALLHAAQATTRQQARSWINVAVLRGATLAEASEALREWDAVHAGDVQTIGGTDPCRCSHHHTGRCPVRACGCTRVRSAR
jgi:hypothetical protein